MAKRPASICVVVTAHNVEECLGECLASLAVQTFPDFEAIVVEDGSSDETARIADEFALQDDRFRVVHTSNLGAAGARNHGLGLVESPHFMLLDGDDVFLPTMLEALHGQAIRCKADVVVCDIVQFDHKSRERTAAPWALKESQLPNLVETPSFSWRDVPGNVFAAFMGWPWDKLYRTAFARSAGLSFPDDLSNSEDMLFTYQAIILAQRIAVVNEVLIEHRIGRGGSVSNSRTRDPFAFYEGLCRMKRFLQELPDGAWQSLRQPYLNWALDWTLWNIETMTDQAVRTKLAQRLGANGFPELELAEHKPAYFTGYPRNMARYASVLSDWSDDSPDQGPFGPLASLPYGKFKPWCQASPLEKLAIKRRLRRARPTEW